MKEHSGDPARRGAPSLDEPPPRKPRKGKVLTTVLVLGLVGGGTYTYEQYVAGRTPDLPAVNDVAPEAARQQATLVDAEDLRVMQVRAKQDSDLAAGGSQAAQARQPRILSSANGRTLVLPQRRQPYYVQELARLAGQDFQRQSDGSYLLGVNIFLAGGGKLILQSASGPLTIRMRSIPGSFVSIVSAGGSVRINGSAQNPVRFTSWNSETRNPDTQVADGRAYVRAIGGEFTMKYASISDLGFWSGRTGGIALTGSDRPDTAAEQLPGTGDVRGGIRLPNGENDTTTGGREEIEVAPAGVAKGRATGFYVPAANLVTGTIDHTTISGNASGIFVTASNQAQITNVSITGSLVHGVLLHRFAKNAVIENTTVTRSRGDGFVLSRGTEGVRVTNCSSDGNGGNGFTLNGQPLADGPSASGETITAFGHNLLSGATIKNNRRNGVEILGGDTVQVQNSRISGGDMGIVVWDRAVRIQLIGNQVDRPRRQGIVLRDGVSGGSVSGNIITGAQTALYLRDAATTISGNTVQSAHRHGLTLKGNVAGTRIADNTLSGSGLSVLDVDLAKGGYTSVNNNVTGWHKTAGFWTWVKRVFKPMNVIWFIVFMLVGISMYRSRTTTGLRIGRRGAHPYAQQAKLGERPVRRLERASTGT